MERISKMWRSGLAMILALCMIISACPVTAFAAETKSYVSLGDSMTNGYGLPGYDKNSGVEDYGNGSYANQFAAEISADHAQLAMSAMRAEDLHWLLELNYNDAAAIALTEGAWDEAAWNAKFSNGDYWTWNEICTHGRTKATTDAIKAKVDASYYPATYTGGYDDDVALIAKYFQESVKNADVISLGMGNGNFGVFMFGRIMEAIGFDGTPSDALVYKVDRAIAECDPAMQAQILSLKDKLYVTVQEKVGVSISGNPTLEALSNTVVYTALSYVLNYAGSVEAILQLNPDAEIILVELMNTFSDGTKDVAGVTLGDLMNAVFTPLNAYIAALPTVMQATGNSVYANATFYYADAKGIQCMVDTYGDDFLVYDKVNDKMVPNPDSIIRDRFVESIVGYCDCGKDCTGAAIDSCTKWANGMVWGLMAGVELAPGMSLVRIEYADVLAYVALDDAGKAAYAATNDKKALSIAVYLAFEDAVSNAGKNGEPVTVDAILALGGLDASLFSGVMDDFNAKIGTAGAAEINDAADGIVAIAAGKGITITRADVPSMKADPENVYAVVTDLSEGVLTAAQVKSLNAASFSDASIYAVVAEKCGKTAAQVENLYLNTSDATVVADVNTIKGYKDTIMGGIAALNTAVGRIDLLCMLLAMPDTLGASLKNSSELAGLLGLFSRCVVGNGLGGHPSQGGHDTLAASVIAAYGNHTAKDETVENVKFVLGEMEGFLKEYGPQAADQLLKVWEKYGYKKIVDDSIVDLNNTLTARYEYYKGLVPVLNDTADKLNGQKTELVAQLNTLNAQLIVKKAELEKVLSEQEIGSIYTPDINIDTELGNNQQTEVPENDCEGTGNVADELAAAVADLEHAIAVIEALIADVSADIDDMVALANEIAAAIAELEKTVASVAAAAMDLKEAFDAIYAILTDENADATAQSFIDVFNTSRKAAETAAVALELVMKTANDDVAAIDASLTALTEGIDALYANFDPAHAESALMGVLPKEVQFGIGAAALILQDLEVDKQAVMDALDAEKTKVLNKLNEDILALGQKYDPEIAAAAQAVEDKKNEMQAAITAKYTEYEQKAIADINALNDQANAQLAILNQELAGYQAELAALADDAAQEVRDGIQAQIDRVNGDIAKVNEDLACAVEHVNTELKAMHDQIVAEVSAEFDAVIAELQKIHDDLVDAYNAAVDALKAAAQLTIDELTAAADEEIQKLIDAANKKIDELGDLADEVKDSINNIFQDIHDEISAAQNAINDILHGDLDAIEDLKEALNNLGLSAVSALVDELTDLIKDLVHQATYADLNVDDGFLYVALGDDTALSEGYVELVAEKIEEEKNLEKGVDILFKNYAKAGNTIGKERENLSDVAEADLITIGFGNANMLKNAIAVALSGQAVSYDWTALVGEQVAPYVQEALAEVYAEIDAAITDADMNTAAKAAVEGLAYNAVEYAVELPQLIAEIREVNEDALIIIVGQYNPMNGAVLDLMGNTMDLNEYIDYFVDAVAVHGIAYSLISGDAIFAEAPDVDILETDTKWSVLDLLNMLQNGFATLNPSEAGDTYIANQILKALNITQLNEVPEHFFKDVTDPNAYYYEAVKWAVKMGITNGYGSPDIFAPDVACNRAQIVTFLWRAAGCPAPKSNVNPFKDVVDGEYYTEAVLWAVEKGITKGYGAADIFAPDVICNRAQIVTMLNRYLGGAASSSNNPFVDVPAGQYYTEAVLWAAQKGITTGTSATTFEPEADCTRGQIVTFLYRALYQHR